MGGVPSLYGRNKAIPTYQRQAHADTKSFSGTGKGAHASASSYSQSQSYQKKSPLMKAFKVLGTILSTLLVAVLLAFVVPQFFGVKYFSVLSGSMEPEMPVGSLVVAAPSSLTGAYQKGDVVSYVADENLTVVTHRVVSVDPSAGTLTTQGDANTTPDPEVLTANVVGKVVLTIPVLGYAAVHLSTTSGKIILLTAVVVIGLIALMASNLKKNDKKRIVITYDDDSDLSPEAFAEIQQRISQNTDKTVAASKTLPGGGASKQLCTKIFRQPTPPVFRYSDKWRLLS